MNRTLLLVTLAAATAALAFLFFRPSPAPVGTFDLAALPRLGSPTAPVTVVVVEDFKCPVCKLFEEQVAPELKARYVDTGKVRVYSLIYPFLGRKFDLNPDDSRLAAQAARCVLEVGGNDTFQAFKSILFRAQGDELKVWATRDRLAELAQSVEGLDQGGFQRCLSTDAALERVEADVQQVERAKVTGTPSVFVNGQLVRWTTMAELKSNLFDAIAAAAP